MRETIHIFATLPNGGEGGRGGGGGGEDSPFLFAHVYVHGAGNHEPALNVRRQS